MKDTNRQKRSIYLTPELSERADMLTKKMGLSFSSLLVVALNEYMKQGEAIEMIATIDRIRNEENKKQ